MTFGAHPASELFPPMDGEDFGRLVADISERGLLEPIVLHEGLVLDGRNRLRACERADVEPRFVEWTQPNGMSPSEWVVSMNLHRRHLTVAQKAAVAVDLLPRLEEEAKDRQGERRDIRPNSDGSSGRSDEKAAEIVGIGRSTVAVTKKIQETAPEVVEQMRTGEIKTVSGAARKAGISWGDGANVGAARKSRTKNKGSNQARLKEALRPLDRYLNGWTDEELKGVTPAQARKLIEIVQRIDFVLLEVERALEQRTVVSRALE